MTETIVVFWFVMMISGADHPTVFRQVIEDLPACEVETKAFLRKPPHELLIRGGKVSAGCEVSFPASEEG